MTDKKKLSLLQLSLLSSGGMLGCGWLFSPFYGYQTAGSGVIISWVITAIITTLIGLSFAKVSKVLPLVGGISRFIGVTHSPEISFVFLILGWLSYVVYLPLEAQSVVQYLGFWFKDLIHQHNENVDLSALGITLAMLIIISLTFINTFAISKITKANSIVGIWKIIIPITVSLIIILCFGHFENVGSSYNMTNFNAENIFLAVTSSGLAFAFSGFQNGLILASEVDNPKKALPYSLFLPIIIGFILYLLLSLSYITTLNTNNHNILNSVAPLLGLASLLGLNAILTILFLDAIIAPLGTTNVYIAVTSRILFGVSKMLCPNSRLTRINKYNSPISCLWINAIIGCLFLFPFPGWKELVNFLSSIIVFVYLAGPVSLLCLNRNFPQLLNRDSNNNSSILTIIIGYIAFICCSLLIYWSGATNLMYLSFIIPILLIAYHFIKNNKSQILNLSQSIYFIIYIVILTLISYLRTKNVIGFPLDNCLVIILAIITCSLTVKFSLPVTSIKLNLTRLAEEIKYN